MNVVTMAAEMFAANVAKIFIVLMATAVIPARQENIVPARNVLFVKMEHVFLLLQSAQATTIAVLATTAIWEPAFQNPVIVFLIKIVMILIFLDVATAIALPNA